MEKPKKLSHYVENTMTEGDQYGCYERKLDFSFITLGRLRYAIETWSKYYKGINEIKISEALESMLDEMEAS